jgi:outer membrane putative beta-barrel porin/alpha-amylase
MASRCLSRVGVLGLTGTLACAVLCRPAAAQVLETETARLRVKGAIQAGANVEIQTSPEGHEAALPFLVEYGITDRWELVVEPVAGTWIRPHAGPRATGAGDTEITLQYLVTSESGRRPAMALAAEVKLPTTRNSLIGTGQADVAGYFIASRRFGNLDAHVNLSYTRVGRPPNAQLSDTIGGAVAGMYTLTPRWRVYAEGLTVTAASAQGEQAVLAGSAPPVPEAAAQELVGTVGAGVYLTPKLFLSLGISYDNTHAVLFRPGITFRSK